MFAKTARKGLEIAEDPADQDACRQRRTLKVIQGQGLAKENHVKQMTSAKSYEPESKKRKFSMVTVGVQTLESKLHDASISEADLMNDTPSEDYWRLLAETRGAALDRSLCENEKLKDEVDSLKKENSACQALLQESRAMIQVLEEMIEEDSTLSQDSLNTSATTDTSKTGNGVDDIDMTEEVE